MREGGLDSSADEVAWIVTGMPGAGKSTVSRLVAAALPRAVRIGADDLNAMIVSGAVWPLGHPADEAERQVELCYRNLGALAHNFTASGFTTIVDCVLPDGDHLDRLLRQLPQQRARLVVLAPGEAACRDRNAARSEDEQFDFDGYRELDATMRVGFGDQGQWIDSADLTGEQTMRTILEQVAIVSSDSSVR
ncbi:AAA family ATPase [Curtobacterium sp. MCLR17_032]|uniref:AAA family ATPase n=1 Tax=Curtobacterium sp. MCLR17_032 TaxID=2175650 RepID=UPI0024DFA069|nr:AAA family ATPase [Curtobacterium sp. MCLR17_032]WIE62222.1 AAA family ATPase [Curtobacterium sp. MCLR17_032]